MANTNNTRKRTATKSYSLQGDNNWETALNTFNFGLGLGMTVVWGTGRLATVGAETTASFLPETMADALVDTATQAGISSTWESFRAEDSTNAIADKFASMKDGFMGSNDDSTDLFIKDLTNKATAKAVMKLATTAQRASFNIKLRSLDDTAYEALLLDIDAKLQGINVTDSVALAAALSALL